MALTLLSQAINGTSFEQIRKGLYLNSDKAIIANQFHDYFELIQQSVNDSELTVINRIYVQQELQLKNDLQEVASEKFFSGIESVEFNRANDTAQQINRDVKEKTMDKITDIVTSQEFEDQTGVILINVVYLRSPHHPWLIDGHPFKELTEEERKEKLGKYLVLGGYFLRVRTNELEAVRMDYENSNLSFVFVKALNIEFNTLEERMRNYTLKSLSDQMSTGKRRISVGIPYVKIETELHLNDDLKKVCIDL